MNTRLADFRLADIDQAKDTMREIALIEKRLAVQSARFEKRIADLAAQHEAETEGRRLALESLRSDLSVFIEANKQLFADPRTVKTEFGEFGLRTVTELAIVDEETVLQSVLERGYEDCFETVKNLVKTAIRKRLLAKENIPGCLIRTGDTVVCKVSKSLIDEAVKALEE